MSRGYGHGPYYGKGGLVQLGLMSYIIIYVVFALYIYILCSI